MTGEGREAGRITAHYMRAAFRKAGLPWDGDYDAEIIGSHEGIDERLNELETVIGVLTAAIRALTETVEAQRAWNTATTEMLKPVIRDWAVNR